jgi:TonB family protein
MLKVDSGRWPALRQTAAAIVVSIGSVAVIGATPAPAPQANTQPGEAVLFGRIVDQTGAVVPGVDVWIGQAGDAQGRRTVTDGSGSYQLQRLTAGDYVVQTTLPGFASTRGMVAVPATGRVEHSVQLDLGSLMETITVVGVRDTSRPPRDPVTRVSPAPPAFFAPKIVTDAPAPSSGLPVRVGGAIKAPAKVADVRPVYPAAAQAAGREGWVVLGAVIDTQGAVKTVTPVGTSETDLTSAAIAAVKQWKFTPTLLNGAPSEVQMMVNVNFVLK